MTDKLSQTGTVLVLGASGFIGSALVPALVELGYSVRAASRQSASLNRPLGPTVLPVICDLLEPASLGPALAGVDQVYYLVHGMTEGRGYAERDLRAASNLAAAAAAAGVQHIIYLGSLIVPGSRSQHFQSRLATGRALGASSVPVTEVRAPVVIGAGSAPFEVFRDVVNHLPGMLVPRQLDHKLAPLALADLIYYLTELAQPGVLVGQVLELQGPESVSYAGMMSRYAAFIGQDFRPVPLPRMPIWLIQALIPAFTSAPRTIIQALLGGLNHSISASDSRLQDARPRPLQSLEQAFQALLDKEERQVDSLDWYQGNMRYRQQQVRNGYYGQRIQTRQVASASPEAVWHQLTQLGGDQGYFFFDWIWRVRGWIDALLGGPGMVRRRDKVDELRRDDRIDTWIILDAQTERRLLLEFRMRSPGAGCLEFVLRPDSDRSVTELTINAYFHPQGLAGRLYWLVLKPVHLLLFHGMSRKILRRASKDRRPD